METTNLEQMKQLLLRCQASSMFFIENFCKVQHPKAGILPFKLFKYQRTSLKFFLTYRWNLYRKTRQCGISTLVGSFALWYAMFFPQKTILVVSKRDLDAMAFLNKNVKFVYEHLPEEFKAIYGDPPPIWNEHTVGFSNGSFIKSLTSQKETLRSNSASLNILDEVAFMPHMIEMWSAGAPTLQMGGCLAPNSLILSKSGLLSINSYHSGKEQWISAKDIIYTDFNIGQVISGYNNGIVDTRKIITKDGHFIEASLTHKFRIIDENGQYSWKETQNLNIGDQLVLSCRPVVSGVEIVLNQDVYNLYGEGCKMCGKFYNKNQLLKVSKTDEGYCDSCITTIRMTQNNMMPLKIDINLAELLGILIGDGWCNIKSGICGVSCDRSYPDFIQYIHNLVFKILGIKCKDYVKEKDYSVRFNSRKFVLLLNKNKIRKSGALTASIPEAILKSPNEIKQAFLRGLFETDGCVSGKYVSFSSASITLVRQIQIVLLSLGMRSRIYEYRRKNGFSDNMQYILSLKTRQDVVIFKDLIGFISKIKKHKLDIIPKTTWSFRDRFTNKSAIQEFYLATKGLPSKIRQKVLHTVKHKAISRHLIIELVKFCPRLSLTTLGKLASNYLFTDNIKEIISSKYQTYDISVESHHTYVANGFVSHNSVIAITTTNGFDAWYQPTWEDALAKRNDFNPIIINWWDMDWEIKYKDELSGKECRISPVDGLRKCETKEELEKWGPYYSPWLEEQYRQLQLKGEAYKFRQEILAEFVGVGNTVLDRVALLAIEKQVDENYSVVGRVGYIHPVTGERLNIDFENQLWIWKKPVKPEPDLIENGRVIRPGRPGHTYSMGVDIASGEADDFDAIEVFDTNTKEQVAELYLKVQPNVLLMMIDYIGRWYNGAYCVPERTGMGIPVCQDLYATIGYSNLYRMTLPSGKRSKKIGFPTSPVYKPTLNKALVDMLGEDGVHVYSSRLLQQLYIYIHTGKNKTGHVEGPGNHSDLSIATGLALIGIGEAVQADTTSMVPMRSVPTDMPDPKVVKPSEIMELASSGGMSALMPIIIGPQGNNQRVLTPQEEIMQFAAQLGGLPMNSRGASPVFVQRKHIITYPHSSR